MMYTTKAVALLKESTYPRDRNISMLIWRCERCGLVGWVGEMLGPAFDLDHGSTQHRLASRELGVNCRSKVCKVKGFEGCK